MKSGLLALSFIFLAFAAQAQAQEENSQRSSAFASVLIGYADPTHIDGRAGYGIDAGWMCPTTGWRALAYGYYSHEDRDAVDEVNIGHYGLGADYAFAAAFPDSWFSRLRVGLKAGGSDLHKENKIAGPSVVQLSGLAWGPSLGLEYAVNSWLVSVLQGDVLIADKYSTLYLWGAAQFRF